MQKLLGSCKEQCELVRGAVSLNTFLGGVLLFTFYPCHSIKSRKYMAHFRDHVSISSESYFRINSPSLGVRVAALSPLAVTATEGSGNNMTIRRCTHLS